MFPRSSKMPFSVTHIIGDPLIIASIFLKKGIKKELDLGLRSLSRLIEEGVETWRLGAVCRVLQ